MEHLKASQQPTDSSSREILPKATASDTFMTQEQSAFPAIPITAIVGKKYPKQV